MLIVKAETEGWKIINNSAKDFLCYCKKQKINKTVSPKSYDLKKKIELSHVAYNQYNNHHGFDDVFIENSIIYSLLYAPFYYFFIKLFIDYTKYNINPIHLIFSAEAITILTKMMLKICSKKDDSQFWENIDQRGISAIYCCLIGAAMHALEKI